LVAAFEQLFCFIWKVVRDAITTGTVGLVDVDMLDGASENWGGRRGSVGGIGCGLFTVGRLTTNGVVEDEDFGCPGTGEG